MSKLYIGTSGWSYDNWAGDFYPKDTGKSEYLEYYVKQFNSVEVNATFYNVPYENVVKSWNGKASDDFKFSVKGHRRITHYNKMKEVEEPVRQFLERIYQLKGSLETIFWQFPPSFGKMWIGCNLF